MLSLFVILFSLSVFAETRIEVSPLRPVDCKEFNYPTVNWIYKLEKLFEDKEEVVYEFVTSYGACVNGKVVATTVEEDMALVDVIRDGLVLPWQKEGVESEVKQESPTELRVRLTYDKKLLFKKKVERSFYMTYEPGVTNGMPRYVRVGNSVRMEWPKLSFPWQIILSVDETWTASIKIM